MKAAGLTKPSIVNQRKKLRSQNGEYHQKHRDQYWSAVRDENLTFEMIMKKIVR